MYKLAEVLLLTVLGAAIGFVLGREFPTEKPRTTLVIAAHCLSIDSTINSWSDSELEGKLCFNGHQYIFCNDNSAGQK